MRKRGSQQEFIEVDMGGSRLTHYPSETTCFRERWMYGRDQHVWDEKVSAFVAAYPHLSEVFDGNGKLVDNLNDWPHRNGAFSVGDSVALVSWFGDNVVADTIIAATPAHSEDAEGNLTTMCYELEGGGQVYWSTMETSWNTNVDGFRGSVRRPLEGEDLEYRVAPAAAGMGL